MKEIFDGKELVAVKGSVVQIEPENEAIQGGGWDPILIEIKKIVENE